MATNDKRFNYRDLVFTAVNGSVKRLRDEELRKIVQLETKAVNRKSMNSLDNLISRVSVYTITHVDGSVLVVTISLQSSSKKRPPVFDMTVQTSTVKQTMMVSVSKSCLKCITGLILD